MNADGDGRALDTTEPSSLGRLRRLIEACDRYEAACREGLAPRIEDALEGAPPVERPALLRSLVAIDVELRRRRGEQPAVREYLGRFPDLPTEVAVGYADAGPDPRPDPEPPATRYDLGDLLGTGGFADVFKAHDRLLRRDVAFKRLKDLYADRPPFREMLREEARFTARLAHRCIIPVFDTGTQPDGSPFYVMHTGGRAGTLKDHLKAQQRGWSELAPAERSLRLRDLVRRFLDVCDAVAFAHSQNIVHRDIKPANILLGEFGQTYLIDWGLSHQQPDPGETAPYPDDPNDPETAHRDRTGARYGTPPYMSPEAARGNHPGKPSDIYALGATLFAIATRGKYVVDGTTPDEIMAHAAAGDVRRLRDLEPDAPPELAAVCARALRFEPGDRYPGPQALADDLTRWLADEPLERTTYVWPRRKRIARWMRRHRTATLAAGVLLAGSVAGLAVHDRLIAAERDRTDEARRAAEDSDSRNRTTITNVLARLVEPRLALAPGSIPLRRELAKSVLDGIDPLLAKSPDDEQLRRQAALARHTQADVLRQSGEDREALAAYRATQDHLAWLRRARPDDPNYAALQAIDLVNWGELERTDDRLDAAEAKYRAVLDQTEPGRPFADRAELRDARLSARLDLVALERTRDRLDEARRLTERLVEDLGPAPPDADRERDSRGAALRIRIFRIFALANLAAIHREQAHPDRAAEALDLARREAQALRAALPDFHDVAFTLAAVLVEQGRLAAAHPEVRKPAPRDAASAVSLLNRLLADHAPMREYRELRAEATQVYAAVQLAARPDPEGAAAAEKSAGHARQELDEMIQEAAEKQRLDRAEPHSLLARTHETLAAIHDALGRPDDARRDRQDALREYEQVRRLCPDRGADARAAAALRR